MTLTFANAAAQTLVVEITNGDVIDNYQIKDFMIFHEKAVMKSGNNLKPVDWKTVYHSDYLVQVKNQDGVTLGQCRLLQANPDCPSFGTYPAPQNGLILASLSGLKHFPLMMDALQQAGFDHITLKTRAANEAGQKVVESCGFTAGEPVYAGDDDYASLFYQKALQAKPAFTPSGSVNQSPVSLEGATVYAPNVT